MKHQTLIQEIEDAARALGGIRLVKVPAHSDEMGNDGADRLAKKHIETLDC